MFMKALLAPLGILAAALVGSPAPLAAAPAQGPTVTRLVQLFTGLETEWLEAVRHKDQAALERLLLDDFELRAADAPGVPVPRADWMRDALAAEPVRSFELRQMAVRSFADTAVVSFLCHLDARPDGKQNTTDVSVVDIWVQRQGEWKAAARYAGPALPASMPGAGARPNGIEKRY
jgi:ketosteroid isomerase-like protein